LIAWSTGDRFPDIAGSVLGITQASSRATEQFAEYTSGQIVFDLHDLSPSVMPVRTVARAAILHELGHLVGLGHTTDRHEIMYPVSQFNVRDYGIGDLRGLALLGTQPCHPDL
jgi:hypothetical protein